MTKRGVVWWAVGRQGVVGTSTTGGQDVGSPNLAEPSHLVSHQAHTWHPSLLYNGIICFEMQKREYECTKLFNFSTKRQVIVISPSIQADIVCAGGTINPVIRNTYGVFMRMNIYSFDSHRCILSSQSVRFYRDRSCHSPFPATGCRPMRTRPCPTRPGGPMGGRCTDLGRGVCGRPNLT